MQSSLGSSAPGWDITRVSFDGITNTPFPSRVPVVACGGAAPFFRSVLRVVGARL